MSPRWCPDTIHSTTYTNFGTMPRNPDMELYDALIQTLLVHMESMSVPEVSITSSAVAIIFLIM